MFGNGSISKLTQFQYCYKEKLFHYFTFISLFPVYVHCVRLPHAEAETICCVFYLAAGLDQRLECIFYLPLGLFIDFPNFIQFSLILAIKFFPGFPHLILKDSDIIISNFFDKIKSPDFLLDESLHKFVILIDLMNAIFQGHNFMCSVTMHSIQTADTKYSSLIETV